VDAGAGHHRHAWAASAARRGDLSRPAHLLRLGNFIYNLPPTLTYIDEPMNWESRSLTSNFREEPAIGFVPAGRLNNVGEGQPTIHNSPTTSSLKRAVAHAGDGCEEAGYILQRLADESKPLARRLK